MALATAIAPDMFTATFGAQMLGINHIALIRFSPVDRLPPPIIPRPADYTTPSRRPKALINRLSGLAVLGLRYFTAQLTPDKRHWCWITLHDSIKFRLDHLLANGIADTFDERNFLLDQQFV